ncbi:MAG: methyltransferase, TrmA family [Clostridiaceae bacterium]|jgi:23S rRNA (uracil1939-C5)-methyltransferase|nr:methyltransferase, TrmA family [Clostridiaceae bacterium]
MKEIPVEKNKEYILKIDGFGYQGEGVGKLENYTIFVPGALLGEKVKVKILKVNKNYAFGKLIDIVEKSEHRVEAVCSIYEKCGGCQLQHLSYKEQLEFKKGRVHDCLVRIGRMTVISKDNEDKNHYENQVLLRDTLGMEDPYRYRNKIQLPIGTVNNRVVIGFYSPRSHNITDADNCFIQEETGDLLIKLTKKWIRDNNISTYDEKIGEGSLRHVMMRKAFKTGQVMVVIVTNTRELPHKKEFIEIMKENIPGITSIIHNINREKTNVILSTQCITLWGSDTISDYIGKYKFNISALSFFQVNPVQTEVLYNKALEFADLKGNEVVFDAYCGTGTISLFLSEKAKKVYGVEIIPEAIENAKINAKENGINNAEFIVGKSEEVIPDLIKKGIKADVVVVDPPRKGCERILLEEISKMGPDKIVYVSCDPGTLARDLAILKDLGYKTVEVQPVDMFPMTAHVECVVLMSRVEK